MELTTLLTEIKADISLTKAKLEVAEADIAITKANLATANAECDIDRRNRLENLLTRQYGVLEELQKDKNRLLAAQSKCICMI